MAGRRSDAPSVDNSALGTVTRTTVPGRYAPLGVKLSVVGFGCDHAPALAGDSLGSDRAVTGASAADAASSHVSKLPLWAHYKRSSSATHSMCGVCGNMSTARTRRSA